MKKLFYIGFFIILLTNQFCWSSLSASDSHLGLAKQFIKTNQLNSRNSFTNSKQYGINLDYKQYKEQVKPSLVIEQEVAKPDSILKVWRSKDKTLNVQVLHGKTDGFINITIYNMLAKPVLEVYQGSPLGGTQKPYTYTKEALSISNGQYFCILEHDDRRYLRKIIISE